MFLDWIVINTYVFSNFQSFCVYFLALLSNIWKNIDWISSFFVACLFSVFFSFFFIFCVCCVIASKKEKSVVTHPSVWFVVGCISFVIMESEKSLKLGGEIKKITKIKKNIPTDIKYMWRVSTKSGVYICVMFVYFCSVIIWYSICHNN